jgi:urease accessory protein
VKACASVRAAAGRDGTVFELLRAEAPLGLFPARDAETGWAQLWLVGRAGGPLGGDDVELRVEVGTGAALCVGSVAASVALAGAAPSVLRVRVLVEPGGRLTWAPEPLVVTARAEHRVEVDIEAGTDTRVWWRDELVLGRHGERPGRCVVSLRADLGPVPWLRHDLAVGPPGWDAGAVLGPCRVAGSVLTNDVDGGVPGTAPAGQAARLPLEAGGTLTVALASDRPTLARLLPSVPVPRSSHAFAAHV